MILPQTYGVAVFLMILSMLCWGSWANLYKVAGKWRFELFYFDYAIGLLAVSVALALTLGSSGYDGFSFVDDMMHAGKQQWLFAFLGGVVFNLGNMLLMASIAVSGMAVAFPVGIGLALFIGVILNYIDKPAANPILLFSGCLLILVAVSLAAYANNLRGQQRHEALARAGKVRSTRRPTTLMGVIIAAVSGLVMGSFLPLLQKAKEGDNGLGPYSVAVLFALGVFLSTFVYNLFFMNLPVDGEPLELRDILKSRPTQHLWGILAGVIWGVGGMALFVVASAPSEAQGALWLTYAVPSAAALLSALWGVLAWREFPDTDARLKAMLALMLVLFACGLAMISLAGKAAVPGL